jgi:predicted transcriptional regulator
MEITDLKRLQVASNEARFLLLKSLIENGGGYIAQLSKKLDIERKTTTFHLKQLEDVGLIEGKYLIGEDRPITIKNFKATPQGKKIYNHLASFNP